MSDALAHPKRKEVIIEEMEALEKNNTWVLTSLPEGKKTVRCKWVFTLKYNPDGSINRYKAQLVVKGFTQSYGIHYFETLSLSLQWQS